MNTREHESRYGTKQYPFEVDSSWYQAKTDILSFEPEELFGTKLHALIQRRKNRNLFDLHGGLRQLSLDPGKLIASSSITWRWMDDIALLLPGRHPVR
ncbi:MAG: nucleotidyl transferase AbiEii/AbiGii toxin family protein [Sulfuricaulis sp.]|uniref:nucleotidyl transferase AbiEii/AbiGii toxin family protein n=1 Tax=Sulfuricaulis sp. TaxID=2003553 RepID=UPI00345D6B57|nr:nucleotidyl transferase AbiEii/AbiGii toxin family protein [Sulfuricaulis sp.]